MANRKGRKAKTSKTKKNVKTVNVEDDSLDINKLSVKETQELQDKGLCFRCRKAGHISRNCPVRPKTTGRTPTRQIRKVEEDSSDETAEDSDEEERTDLDIKALKATDFNSHFP